MIRPHRRSFMKGTSARVSAMHRAQVQLDEIVPVLVTNLVDRLGKIAARVIDQDIDAAERLDSRLGKLVGLVAMTHVGDRVLDPARRGGPYFPGRGLKLVLVPAGDENIGAGLGETQSHGLAQSLASPGH